MIKVDVMTNTDNPDQLVVLTYVSKATQNIGILSLMHLLNLSSKWNRAHHLTGVLLYENGYFSQILEGKRRDVLIIWEKIKNDHRHQIIKEQDLVEIAQRTYPIWALRFYDGDKITKKYPQSTHDKGRLPDSENEVLSIMRGIAKGNTSK